LQGSILGLGALQILAEYPVARGHRSSTPRPEGDSMPRKPSKKSKPPAPLRIKSLNSTLPTVKFIRELIKLSSWIDLVNHSESELSMMLPDFIIGSMQYCDVPRRFYADRLPRLIAWLDKKKINYYLKKELKFCLQPEEKTSRGTVSGEFQSPDSKPEPF